MLNARHLRVQLARRDFLGVGSLAALGLGLGHWPAARTARGETPASAAGRAKACILIWLDGGPSHLETFDPKPDAPAEVRGPFGTVATSVAGLRYSEFLPRSAAIANHLAVIRSVTSPLGEHNFGAHYLLTGYKPTPALEYPSVGAVVSHLRPAAGALPPHVAAPDFRVGGANFSGHGYLPASCRPFEVAGDPSRGDFRVAGLDLYPGLNAERIERRREFSAALDNLARGIDRNGQTAVDPALAQAFRLATSNEAREAFDLSREKAESRARYGPRTIGQCCLLARRLVERGVPFVTVNNVGWDTHDSLVTRLKEGYAGAVDPVGLVPSLDLALSGLVGDLAERGLLDKTLVVVMGEFGRTPKLNTAGGRDHWPRVFSVVMAGGGVAGGQAIGRSDAAGESPADRELTPADVAATIYTLLGIDPAKTLLTADGRPVPIIHDGRPIREIVG